jgi:1-deoxy-D-xylulose-5-phosphate synthase
VGIAEEHAVTFACGLAAKGLKPVAAIYSTFIQRAVDQIIHDAAMQNLPITLALDRAGFVGEDGLTHQGLFDIALFRPVPNASILAPASQAELRLMLDWALEDRLPGSSGPVIVRYPKALFPPELPAFSLPLERGRGVFVNGEVHAGGTGQICLAFSGSLYAQAADAAARLADRGIKADLYNLRFLKPIDEDYLASVMNRYELVVFIEEGIAAGGFGEYAAALSRLQGWKAAVTVLAVEENFASLGTREELLRMNGLDGQGIADRVMRSFEGLRKKAETLYI